MSTHPPGPARLEPLEKEALDKLIADGEVEVVPGAERDGYPLYRLTPKGTAIEEQFRQQIRGKKQA